MSRIIKLTESQLCDMVTRVINEQNATPLVDEIYKEFVAGGTGAKATSHTVMASAINKIPNYKTLIDLNNMIKTKTPGGFKSFVQCLQGWLKVGEENIFKNIQAKLKTLGVNLIINNPSGVFRPTDIRIVKGQAKTTVQPKVDPNKPTYRICTGFPIKYGCKQTEVGILQKCMGMEVDYSFGPDTLGVYLKLNTDPKAKAATQKQILEVGLSEGAYKLVIAKCKSKIKKIKKPTKPTPTPVDTRTKTEPLTLSSKKIQQLPVKIDLPKLVATPAPGVDQARKEELIGKIKNRGFDQVYKGEVLSPEETKWLEYYMSVNYGTQLNKTKEKSGGEEEKLRFGK